MYPVMESALKGKAKRSHMNASQCSSLAQSDTGSQSITQPFTVNFSNTNLTQRLHPWGPTKRKKTDGTHQKGINEFFKSAGVLSSSPCNSPNKPTMNTEAALNRSIVPKEEAEEQKLSVDFVEGITEEMFVDDNLDASAYSIKKEQGEQEAEVAGCSSWISPLTPIPFYIGPSHATVKKEEPDEYDIESLPDAHYGLLGLKTQLLEPQGQIHDLPEEVLRAVFSHISAGDLYRHVSLVCQRWRNIVMDSQFLPWKKLYFRYEKQQEEAVREVKTLLEDNQIIKTNYLCVLNMVRYMSQFKHSREVNVSDVLLCVKGNRLYSQAEACIKHRLPDIQTVDGSPNPWSAMALMLILSDGIKDVLDMVACLRSSGCLLTPGGICEFVWAVATLLLAMRDANISISNRWHYNVFYVLHLLENTSPPPICGIGRQRQSQVTHEQQQILNHDIQRDHVVKIMAFAGTGKTTTLVKYAQQRPDQHFLYVAFNKSVATQAKRTFPTNVVCKTIHSLAYKAIGIRYRELKKQCNNVHPFTVAWVLPKGRGGFVNAKVVTQTINKFCSSIDECIGTQHVPDRYINTNGREEHPSESQKMAFANDAQNIWNKMMELKPTRERAYHMTHDGYLKLWQLQKPVIEDYDTIFIDEAQDCSPVVMDILLPQHCGKILVGDPHQQIYTFRGAVNALHAVPHTHLYYLTQSFRFGSEIAYIGATILDVCKKVKKILVGGYQDGSVRGEDSKTLETLRQACKQVGGKIAILSRCNVTVFCEAVRLTDANPNCKIHIVGGVDNFGLRKILDIWILMQPEDRRRRENLVIEDLFIQRFTKEKLGGYGGLKRYATNTEDRELEAKLSVVEKFNTLIPELVNRIYNCAESKPHCADYILGTVHKSKGLEFDTVVVTDDFIKMPCSQHNLCRLNINPGIRSADHDEWNLLYVAVTRAQRTLYITKTISNILTLAREYFLRVELSSTLLKEDSSRKCSTRECHNCVTKESPLIIHKLPVRYIDSVDEGGVLCATCVEQRVGPMAFLLSTPEFN